MAIQNIKGITPKKNPKTYCQNLATMAEIIEAVNGILNVGKPKINWFAPADDAVAAVHIKDGKYEESKSNKSVIYGGTVSDKEVKNLKVVAYKGTEGGVYAEGSATDVVVDGAVISTAGDGQGIGGPSSAAAVKYGAHMTLRNAIIDTNGRTRYATAAEEYGTLHVYDSVIYAHGIPYGDDIERPSALMSTPPPPLEIDGNTRTHCSMSNSTTYFYDSTIICDGWAALSTESSEGYVYLEANNCDIICTKSGYGAYSDPGCHDFFNDCRIDTSNMAAIVAGNSDMTFNNCDSECGSYFALTHCVNGWKEEVADLTVTGGRMHTGKECVLIKSHNCDMQFTGVEMSSDKGILFHTIVNDDPCTTPVDDTVFGVNISLADMDVKGDIIHEDNQRPMYLTLASTTVTGEIQNATIKFEAGSKFIATKNSSFILDGEVNPAQIDAMSGVTVTIKGAEEASFDCQGGGKVVVTK